jgi:raffinose/stachyose/melibiose transport system substrate-binding protein
MAQSGRERPRGDKLVVRAVRMAAVVIVGAAVLGACSSGSSGGGGSSGGSSTAPKNVTLTVWQNGNLQDTGFGFMTQVAKNFEAAHPGVKVEILQKPQDNYFALLHTALISHQGPDVADMYAGSYEASIQPYLLNLNDYVPASTIKSITGVQYYAKNGDPTQAVYAIPPEDQFYNMWYNKSLFAKAGITTPPTDYSQLEADCQALRAKGIVPLADGSPSFTTPGSGAVQDWSYLAGAAYPLAGWNSILTGATPYNSPALVKSVTNWAGVYKAGCTSPQVTTQPTDTLFETGKVAMSMNFNGLYPSYHKALGSKLGVMLPPWSETPQPMMVELPGAGYGVDSASPNKQLAAQFVAFTVTPESQKLEAEGGGIPVISSVPAIGLPQQLVTMARSGKYHLYPMMDNYMQPEVVAQIDNQLPQAFIGKTSPQAALTVMNQALQALPASERQVQYHLGSGG